MKESLSLKLYRTSWSPFSKGWVIWSKNNSYIPIHCHNRNKKYGCIHIQISHSKHYLATIISNFDFRWSRKDLFSNFLMKSWWNFILTCGNNPILKSKSLKLMWIRYSSEVRLLEEFSNCAQVAVESIIYDLKTVLRWCSSTLIFYISLTQCCQWNRI